MTRTMNAIVAVMCFQLVSRGMDYLLGNPEPGKGIFMVTDAAPAMAWGASCILAAAIVGIGLVKQSLHIIRSGAILAGAIYIAFAVVVFDDVYLTKVDDWRFFTAYLTAAAIWIVVAYSLTMRIAVKTHREEEYGG